MSDPLPSRPSSRAPSAIAHLPPLVAGMELAGATLQKRLSDDGDREVWRAELSGVKVAVHAFTGAPASAAADRFRAAAETLKDLTEHSPIQGVLRVHAASDDRLAYVADLWTVGSIANLSALGWGLEPRVALLTQLCSALEQLHALGIPHGCLLPSNILLDDDLRPILSDIGLHDPKELAANPVTRAYVAPELTAGAALSTATEIFSLGQVLQLLLLDSDPPAEYDALPKLDAIAAIAPAGLVRIARKSLLAEPTERYATVADLALDLARFEAFETVGVAHPEVTEANVPVGRYVSPAVRSSLLPQAGGPPKSAPQIAAPNAPARAPSAANLESAYAATPTPATRPKWLPIAWLAAVIVGAAATFIGAGGNEPAIVWRIASALGFGGFFALLPYGGAAKASRLVIGVGFLGIGFALDLAANDASLSERFSSSDPHVVVSAVRADRARGGRKFTNVVLTGGDLRGQNFHGCDLAWTNLNAADLTGADLSDASLKAAKLKDANLSSAVLTGVDVKFANLSEALCDLKTVLPSDWECRAGHPSAK